jgi:hypothetical protein
MPGIPILVSLPVGCMILLGPEQQLVPGADMARFKLAGSLRQQW